MGNNQTLTPQEQRKRMAETMWLHYFNQVLFSNNMITEQERNRIANRIVSRKPSAAKSPGSDKHPPC